MNTLNIRQLLKEMFFVINFAVLSLIALTATANANEAGNPMIINVPVYQLRIYELFDHNKQAFHERFRDHAARLMEQYQFNIVTIWEAKNGDKTEFVYVIEWPDEETMRRQWQAFRADQEWDEIKTATSAQHGEMVGVIAEKTMRSVTYSPALK